MRPGFRALVWIVAILCLAATTRYGVLYALSQEPPAGADALDLALPERPRLVVAPVAGLAQVDARDLVVYTDANGSRIARALFTATWNASGGYDVPALNATNATEVVFANVTYALPATLGNGTGLFVADDRGGTPHTAGAPLVGEDRLEGVVARVEDGGRLLLYLAVFTVGALVPILVLVMTQRPRRAPTQAAVWDPALAPSPATVPCIDCGRPVNPSATFCTACGAYLRREGGPPP